MTSPDSKSQFRRRQDAWIERSEIASRQGQAELARIAMILAEGYHQLLEANLDIGESDQMLKANILRKQIEASEQHRTMCVEHGLSDAAIDTTYEIQAMEAELLALFK